MVTLDLSAEQASALQAFFITSAAYRKDEIDSWEKLAAKRNAEGNPMLSKAKSNAEFFRKQDATIREISELLAKAQAEASATTNEMRKQRGLGKSKKASRGCH